MGIFHMMDDHHAMSGAGQFGPHNELGNHGPCGAGMTITETIARAIADGLKSNAVYVSDDLRNCSVDGGLFDMHSLAGPILAAIADAGFAVVPLVPLMVASEEGLMEAIASMQDEPANIMPLSYGGNPHWTSSSWSVDPMPYKAPAPIEGETHGDYIMRMAESFEQWANKRT